MSTLNASRAGDPGGLRGLNFVLRQEETGRWTFISRELVRGYHLHATACVERGEECPSFDEWLCGAPNGVERTMAAEA